jgi:hypothetical protein
VFVLCWLLMSSVYSNAGCSPSDPCFREAMELVAKILQTVQVQ